CVEIENAISYLIGYDHDTKLFDCFCLNTAEDRIAEFSYDYEPGKEAELTGDEFYSADKLHWTHMPVTYFIINEEECGDYETRKIIKAFDEIENATDGAVYFEKTDKPADIDIHCSFLEGCYEYNVDIREEEGRIYKWESICSHEKGVARITKIKGNKILKAEIELIGLAGFAETTGKGASGFYIGSCGHSTTEIHEILHTFGYGHIDDEDSIMYFQEDAVGLTIQEEGQCIGSKKYIDEEISEDLIDIYSRIIS
ncbi:hypothetical protein KY343_05160, partial [Candidatus Woesearchaeota archaeon]|nr:hypothetical protein [Candidatus Woesearchaeota archaeon]